MNVMKIMLKTSKTSSQTITEPAKIQSQKKRGRGRQKSTIQKKRKPNTSDDLDSLSEDSFIDTGAQSGGNSMDTGVTCTKKLRSKQPVRVSNLKARCIVCGLITYFNSSVKHLKVVHLNKMGKEGEDKEEQEKDHLKVKCMVCKEIVSMHSFRSHVIEHHPPTVGKATNFGHVRNTEVGCLHCDVTVRSLLYMDHLKGAHPEEADKFVHKTKLNHKKTDKIPTLDTIESDKIATPPKIKCAYCDDAREMTTKEYKAHVFEYHPDYEDIVPKVEPKTELDKNALQAKYLYVDRSKNLPPKPDPPETFTCESCKESFSSKRSYQDHSRIKHDLRHCCQFCYKIFKHKPYRKDHEDEEHALEKYKCETCGKLYIRASSLRIHKKSVHLGIIPQAVLTSAKKKENNGLLCNHCGKTFKQQHHLKTHMELLHSEGDTYICDICGKLCSSESYLKLHKRTVHVSTRTTFKCTFCDFSCQNRSAYLPHLRIHTGEKPYKCIICGARFRIAQDLREHLQSDHELQVGKGMTLLKYYHPEGGRLEEASEILRKNYEEASSQAADGPSEMTNDAQKKKKAPKSLVNVVAANKIKKFVCAFLGCDKRYHTNSHLRYHEREKHGVYNEKAKKQKKKKSDVNKYKSNGPSFTSQKLFSEIPESFDMPMTKTEPTDECVLKEITSYSGVETVECKIDMTMTKTEPKDTCVLEEITSYSGLECKTEVSEFEQQSMDTESDNCVGV